MNFFELVEQSEIGREQAQKLKGNISANIHYEFIDRIDEVLKLLDDDQQKIVKLKFNNFGSLGQLYDKLSEILVAYRFLGEDPIFGDDIKGEPDLFLGKTGEYVEVKRLNNSDYQKSTVEFMLGYGEESKYNEQGKENSVYKKAYELIDKAVEQLKNKRGYIFLIYSVDVLNYINDFDTRKEELEKIAKSYAEQKELKDIKFEMIHGNELFGRVLL